MASACMCGYVVHIKLMQVVSLLMGANVNNSNYCTNSYRDLFAK